MHERSIDAEFTGSGPSVKAWVGDDKLIMRG